MTSIKELNGLCRQIASEHGVNADFMQQLIFSESSFRADAVAYDYAKRPAKGLGQFQDATWRVYGEGGNPYEPVDALHATARYITKLAALTDGTVGAVVTRYKGIRTGDTKKRAWDYLTKQKNPNAQSITFTVDSQVLIYGD